MEFIVTGSPLFSETYMLGKISRGTNKGPITELGWVSECEGLIWSDRVNTEKSVGMFL